MFQTSSSSAIMNILGRFTKRSVYIRYLLTLFKLTNKRKERQEITKSKLKLPVNSHT